MDGSQKKKGFDAIVAAINMAAMGAGIAAVHVPHLPPVDAEFNTTKAMIVHRHPGPAEQLALGYFACGFHHLYLALPAT